MAVPRRIGAAGRRAGGRRRRPGGRCRSLPTSPDGRHACRAVLGRRRAAQRSRARPPTRRIARPDLHLGAARGRGRDPRRPGGRPPSLGLGAGRDRGRPADRCGPGRDIGPGHGRDPQPDPSPLACRSRGARTRARRGGPRADAPRRVPLPAGPPHPGVGRVIGLAGHLAVSVRGDLRAPPRRRDSLAADPAGHPAGRRSRRRAGPGLQDDAARRPGIRRRRKPRTTRSGGSRTTSSPGP